MPFQVLNILIDNAERERERELSGSDNARHTVPTVLTWSDCRGKLPAAAKYATRQSENLDPK